MAIGPRAAGQPGSNQIAAFLTTYFTAINNRDYQTYISLFDSQSQPIPSRQQFLAGYQTTQDSGARLVRISPAAAGSAASITFDSHQSPADSATHTACTSWRITLYLETDGSTYLIGKAPPGYHAQFTPCP